jgi:WD40 repeat protein
MQVLLPLKSLSPNRRRCGETMIIFGWGVRRKAYDIGQRGCPHCQSYRPFQHVVASRWFSLFFIPLIPLGRVGEYLACTACGSQYPIQPPNEHSGATGGSAPQSPSMLLQQTGEIAAVRTSLLGIFSFVFGLLVFPSCLCTCLVPTPILPIVLGHLSLSEIRKSQGQVNGRWLAIAGMVLGYLAMTLFLVAVVYRNFFYVPSEVVPGENSGTFASEAQDPALRLKDAETVVFSDRDGQVGHGNSPRAVELATAFSNSLKEAHGDFFEVKRKRVLQLSKGNFLTYCELKQGSCCFIVHVPSYRDYDSEAEEVLARLAWATAQQVASLQLSDGDALAVGLRGTLLYGDIMVGKLGTDGSGASSYREGNREDLVTFFKLDPPPDVQAVAPLEATSTPDTGLPKTDIDMDWSADPQVPDNPFLPTESVLPFSQDSPKPEPAPPKRTAPRTQQEIPKVNEEPAFINTLDVRSHRIIENKSWNINSVDFSPDGKYLVVGKLDAIVNMYATSSGEQLFATDSLRELGQVQCVAFSHDGKVVLAAGYSGQTIAWQVTDDGRLEQPEKRYRLDGEATAIDTSPTFGFGIVGSRRGTLVWQPFKGEPNVVRTNQLLTKAVIAVHLPSEGNEAFASSDRTWVHFNLRDGAEIKRGEWTDRFLKAIAVNQTGTLIALLNNKRVAVVDAKDKLIELDSFEMKPRETWHSVAWHPNGRWIAVGGRDQVVVLDRETDTRVAQLEMPESSSVQNLSFSNDGRWMVAAGGNAGRSIHIFEFPKSP